MKNLLKMSVYFISGIDTDAGKSIATGVIAATLQNQGRKVITQKFIQTGCREISEDIQNTVKLWESRYRK